MSVKKSPRKNKLMRPLISGGMIAIVAIAGIVGSIGLLHEKELVIGMSGYFNSIDPLYVPDDAAFTENTMIWAQVIEGLYGYNQSNSDEIIPCLAKDMGTWSMDGLNFTCQLRDDVRFHDGTIFNAAAVKWNFDRIYKIINARSWYNIWAWYYLYLQPNGSQLINETIILDEYSIKFVLNTPYTPFTDLLTAFPSSILSSSSTPEDNFVDKIAGRLIGTGPFILESWEVDPSDYTYDDARMNANKNYWGGKPRIDSIHFRKMRNLDAFESMLSHNMHYMMAPNDEVLLDIYVNSPEIIAKPIISHGISFLSLNNDIFPLEMRQAISFAFNYSDFTRSSKMYIRCKSPVSKEMRYSNWSLNIAEYDIQVARQVLVDASWPGTSGLSVSDNITAGNEWETLVDNETPIATYYFSVKVDNDFHFMVFSFISRYLKQIGVELLANELSSQEWWDGIRLGGLDFYFVGWGPSFNDPVEMLNPLYCFNATYNNQNFNDSQVQLWLEQGQEERNEIIREGIYNNIQKRVVEELFPSIWIRSPIVWQLWTSNVINAPLSFPLTRFILKDVYF